MVYLMDWKKVGKMVDWKVFWKAQLLDELKRDDRQAGMLAAR
jgi:hypothetical protein